MNYVIGDIHGKYDKMLKALENAGFDKEKDVLFSVGDFCDRGSESRKVVEYLMGLGDRFKAVFGNHDIWLYQFLKAIQSYETETEEERELHRLDRDVFDCWIHNGGSATLESFEGISPVERERILIWLEKMPYRIELDKFIIQHTFSPVMFRNYYFPNNDYSVNMKDLLDNDRIRKDYDEVFWNRETIYYSKAIAGAEAWDIEEVSKDITKKTLIIGHTPIVGCKLPAEPIYDKELNFILIDTGSFIDDADKYGIREAGAVTVMNLDTLQWYTSAGKQGTFTK